MDGRRSGREQDRNQGDKEGGSDEVIHVEGTIAKCDGVFVGVGQLPRTKKALLAKAQIDQSINRSINTNQLPAATSTYPLSFIFLIVRLIARAENRAENGKN